MAAETRSVLIVDDDAQIRSLLADLLKENGYATQPAKTAAEATTQIAKQRPDLVMMDVKLPDQDGLDLLRQIKRAHPELDIIVMTAFGGSSSAIKAMENGAYDYVTKPFEVDDLLATLRRVFEHHDMTSEVSALRLELGKTAADREKIVGSSKPMMEVYKLIGKVAPSEATVLISGESGTGKELVAEALHRASKRNPHPLIKVYCAALPETLLETELFGHEKGVVHRRHDHAQGPLRGRRQGHHLPGRDRRDDAGHPDQAAAHPAGARVRAHRLQHAHQGRHPGHHRHQPRPGRGGGGRQLPRGPLLPAERDPHRDAAAARPDGGHPAAGRALPGQVPMEAGRHPHRHLARRRSRG